MRSTSLKFAGLLSVALALFAVLGSATGCGRANRAAEIIDRISVNYTQGPTATYPEIEPVDGAPSVPDVTLTWSFEGADVTIQVPINGEVLEGARAADKRASIPVDWTADRWQPDYYRAFMTDTALEGFLAGMQTELREVRAARGLDDDRYAELIITMAQSIEYFTDGSPPKFPIELIADGQGDCDDKALLAAALLAREGYQVSLLSFATENHMSLGIASNGSTFRSSGYSFVEMTSESLVGWYNRDSGVESTSGTKLESEPMVISASDGGRAYGSGMQTDAIRDTFDASRSRVDELNPQIDSSRAQYDSIGQELDALRAEMDARKAAGDTQGYNELVDDHNALLSEYNRGVDAYNALVNEQRALAERGNRILDSQGDRYGLAVWLGL